MRLENRLEMLHPENVSDELSANREKEYKCATLRRSVSRTFLLSDPFWLREITMDPHILDQVNTVPG
jgi:hypothetical protein